MRLSDPARVWLLALLGLAMSLGLAYAAATKRGIADVGLLACAFLVAGYFALRRTVAPAGVEAFVTKPPAFALSDMPPDNAKETFRGLMFDPEVYASVFDATVRRFGTSKDDLFPTAAPLGDVHQRADGVSLARLPGMVWNAPKANVLLNTSRGGSTDAYSSRFTVMLLLAIKSDDVTKDVEVFTLPGNHSKSIVSLTAARAPRGGLQFTLKHSPQDPPVAGAVTEAVVTVQQIDDEWLDMPLLITVSASPGSRDGAFFVQMRLTVARMNAVDENLYTNEVVHTGRYPVTNTAFSPANLPATVKTEGTVDMRLFAFAMFQNIALDDAAILKLRAHYLGLLDAFTRGPPAADPGACPYPNAVCKSDVCKHITNWADPAGYVYNNPRCNEKINAFCSAPANKAVAACFCWNQTDNRYKSAECRLWRAFMAKDEKLGRGTVLENLTDDELKALKSRYTQQLGCTAGSPTATTTPAGGCTTKPTATPTPAGGCTTKPTTPGCHAGRGHHRPAVGLQDVPPIVNPYKPGQTPSTAVTTKPAHRTTAAKPAGKTEPVGKVLDPYAKSHKAAADGLLRDPYAKQRAPDPYKMRKAANLGDKLRWRQKPDSDRVAPVVAPSFDMWDRYEARSRGGHGHGRGGHGHGHGGGRRDEDEDEGETEDKGGLWRRFRNWVT